MTAIISLIIIFKKDKSKPAIDKSRPTMDLREMDRFDI